MVTACWIASRVPDIEGRARLIESAAIALALITTWVFGRYLSVGSLLERPTSLALVAYVLVRAIYGATYLLPCAALAVESLARSDGALNFAWLTALQCALIASKPLRVLLIAVPLAFAIYAD